MKEGPQELSTSTVRLTATNSLAPSPAVGVEYRQGRVGPSNFPALRCRLRLDTGQERPF